MSRGRSFFFDVVIEYSRGDERRRLRCAPLLLGVATGVFGLSLLGVVGLGGSLIQRDDALAALTARQKQTQLAYEDRIATLRRRVDELVGRQLLDQDSVEGKMQTLVRRQAQLETRAAAVSQLVERALGGGVTAIARAVRDESGAPPRGDLAGATIAPAPAPAQPPVNEPYELRLNDSVKPTPLPASDDPPRAAAARGSSAALAPAADPARPLSQRLQSLAARLETIARDQRQRLAGVMRPALKEAARLRGVFELAGVPTSRYLPHARNEGRDAGGVGGPFIATPDPGDSAGRFEKDLAVAQSAFATLDQLRRALPATPVRAPLAGPLQPTSSFGYRTDPFLGRPALHSGVDLRDSYGAPVRAAAGGVVSVAGGRGGYGNMVEIDHGDGMSTRYGHLSEIDVVQGEPVKPGAVIGRVGSSGRSTGPHLHYEVRIDGEAVDPARFLEAAALLEKPR
jgi:murein DD-endopeptidase MepM/ murein hydrolase activator NlpD